MVYQPQVTMWGSMFLSFYFVLEADILRSLFRQTFLHGTLDAYVT